MKFVLFRKSLEEGAAPIYLFDGEEVYFKERGEQMLNAKSFEARGYCKIVADEKLSDGTLFLDTLAEVYQNREKYVKNMKNGGFKAIDNKTLAQKIQTFAKNKEK